MSKSDNRPPPWTSIDHSAKITGSKGPEFASLLAACGAGTLAIAKIILYWQTGSLIVAVSAVDSAMDVLVSLVNRRALVFARQIADADHPYGHGKAESIAALGQGALLIGASLAVMVSAVENLYRLVQTPVEAAAASWFSVLFFLGAASLSLVITFWLRHNSQKHHSPALAADAEHYQSDVYTNVGSALGLSAVYLVGVPWLDPAIAGLMAIKIAASGVGLARTSVNELMDHDVPQELKEAVQSFALEVCPMIHDIHRFRGRRSGHRYLFDFHVTLPEHLSFHEVHNIVERLEDTIKERFIADVIIHADPTEDSRASPS